MDFEVHLLKCCLFLLCLVSDLMAGSQTTTLDLVGLLTRATLYTNLLGVSPKWLRLKLLSVLWLFSDNMPCLIGMRVSFL